MNSDEINSQALPRGTCLEEFVIERVLGTGGFGITYLALDSRLGRQVVIKENLPVQFCYRDTQSLTVAPRHAHSDDVDNFQWSLENFSKEAGMLAALDHRGIVKVHRSFEAFGTAYFVMPFVEGLAFDELIDSRTAKGQPFSEEELRGFLKYTLRALGYLHERGIYHRDIKPGNILITLDGEPVLIDFGSARQRLSERSMTVVESAGYTPFEQLQSRGNVGPWSDLYALGGTVYKAVTGVVPPKAMDRMRDDPHEPLLERPELRERFTPSLLGSIDKALAVEETERWQDASEWCLDAIDQAMRIEKDERELPARDWKEESEELEERKFEIAPGMEMVFCWIPPGGFLMGSPISEEGRSSDEDQVRVRISEGFWLGKYEVTQGEWETVMGSNPSHFKTTGKFPVDNVSWEDICGDVSRRGGFLGKMGKMAPEGWRYDLPSEAQWEYACRAGTTEAYAGNLDRMAWYGDSRGGGTHAVGRKEPNAWGLCDMHGNVWEWCRDWYRVAPQRGVDPEGPTESGTRVCRGGSWFANERNCRSAYRYGFTPSGRCEYVGFRLCLARAPG